MPRLSLGDALAAGIATAGTGTYAGVENVVYTFPEVDTKLHIGNYSSLADEIRFLLGGEHATDWITTSPLGWIYRIQPTPKDEAKAKTKGNITIKNDVWIGMGVTILSGVTIGNGAIVAATATVVKDIPAYAVVGGVPAKVIRYRYTPEQIEALERIAWWNWDEYKVKDMAHELTIDSDIEEFIKRYDR